jgi:hypothetical protein
MGTSTSFGSKKRPAGKVYRTYGPLARVITDIYNDVDAGFLNAEGTIVPKATYTSAGQILVSTAASTVAVRNTLKTVPIVALANDTAIITAAHLVTNGVTTITPTAPRSKATDTAANIIALTGAVVGTAYEFTVANLAANFDLTITAGASVTLVPATITVAAGFAKSYNVIVTSATTVTLMAK